MTKTLEQFREEFGNPNSLDSSSQFHPDKRGKLFQEFEQFLTTALANKEAEARADERAKVWAEALEAVPLEKENCTCEMQGCMGHRCV